MLLRLDGPRHPPQSGGKPKALVVLLHGLGADGNDLIGLAPYWAPLLPDAEFLSPHAPYPCDMAPYGRQWFSLQDRSPEMILAGVRATAPILDAFLDDALKTRGLQPAQMALVGFSQGTMMALHVGLRREQAVAGIVGYSGALRTGDTLANEMRVKPPILLVHGEADPVVPFEALGAAERALRALDVPVETLARPGLGHSIDEAGLHAGGAFLSQVLAPAGMPKEK